MAAGAMHCNLPPRSEALVKAELAAGTHHIGQLGLVEPWPSQRAELLMVGHTLVDTRGPMLAVRVLNMSDSPRTVRSGAVVAKCSLVVEVTGGSGSTCLPVQPDEKGNLGEIVWPEGVQAMMTRSEEGLTSEQIETLHNLVGKNLDVFSLSPEDGGHMSLIRHHINTSEARPTWQVLPMGNDYDFFDDVIGGFVMMS